MSTSLGEFMNDGIDLDDNFLINFDFVPNGLISGLSTNDLNKLTKETALKTCEQQSFEYPTIPNEIEYPQLDPGITIELDQAEMSMRPKSSVSQTVQYTKKFKDFLSSKNYPDNIETMPETVLSDYLRYFNHSLKKNNESYYCPATLVCIRAAIHRYLTQAPNNRNIDIINGPAFKAANNMLKTKVGQYLKSGAEQRKQTVEIEQNDLERLSSYFNRSTPVRLQQEVWYNIQYNFGMRGRENMRELTVDTFTKEKDSSGRTYIRINETRLSKNVKASLSHKEFDDLKNAKMYEQEDKSHCPIQAFETYISRLHDPKILWAKDSKTFENDSQWYHKKLVIGKNLLGKMMPEISKAASLSKKYTNHSVRSTVINQLYDKGFSKEQICKVTGHKNSRSLESYIRKRCTDEEMFDMNKSLYNSLHSQGPQSREQQRTSSVSSQIDRRTAVGTCRATTQEFQIASSSQGGPQFQTTTRMEVTNNVSVHGPSTKKMKVVCKGEENIIEIHFS